MVSASRFPSGIFKIDRKSTRLNSSHTEIYTLSLHDALPILKGNRVFTLGNQVKVIRIWINQNGFSIALSIRHFQNRSEEHTSELQSHRDLHSFPTRRSSDLKGQPSLHAWKSGKGHSYMDQSEWFQHRAFHQAFSK